MSGCSAVGGASASATSKSLLAILAKPPVQAQQPMQPAAKPASTGTDADGDSDGVSIDVTA
jgi:hypothetical protein